MKKKKTKTIDKVLDCKKCPLCKDHPYHCITAKAIKQERWETGRISLGE